MTDVAPARSALVGTGDHRSYVSPYHQRVRLVAYALRQNSALGETEATALAVHVLQAIDHIPERVR